jgi:hypothetical protein
MVQIKQIILHYDFQICPNSRKDDQTVPKTTWI